MLNILMRIVILAGENEKQISDRWKLEYFLTWQSIIIPMVFRHDTYDEA